jgi:ketosteroid isomerase-like protein
VTKPACLLAAITLLPGVARAQSAAPSPQQQIQPLLNAMEVAARTHDTDRFLAPYLHDSTLVLVFNGVVTRGFDQVRALQLRWWNNGKSDVTYRKRGPTGFEVLTSGIVVATDTMSSSRTDSSGVVHSGDFAVTMVWQKRAAGWRIVYAHESTVR